MEKVNFNCLWIVGVIGAIVGRFIVVWLKKRKDIKANLDVKENE